MMRHAIQIQRPIEDVFAVVTDVTRTGRWYPADVEEWWVTPPPYGVGSIRRARVKRMGRASENEAVVIQFEPPDRAAIKGISSAAPFEIKLAFRSSNGGTRVDVDSTFQLRGLLRLVGPLFIGPYERGWDRGLAKLKRMMEAGEL